MTVAKTTIDIGFLNLFTNFDILVVLALMPLILKKYRANRIYKFLHGICINPLKILRALWKRELLISYSHNICCINLNFVLGSLSSTLDALMINMLNVKFYGILWRSYHTRLCVLPKKEHSDPQRLVQGLPVL